MSATKLADVTNQIRAFWSDLAMDELRASTLLPGLVNKDYEGEIKNTGDTVKIYQVNAAVGQLRTVGTDADAFATEKLSTSTVSLQATKRAVAAFEIEDLVQIQSQIQIEENGGPASQIRSALVYGVNKQINDYVYSLVAPSASAPDHVINSVTDCNAANLSANRLLAATAKWGNLKGWYGLLDPSYYSDVLNATTLTSKDYVGDETPVIAGQVVNKRFSFNLLEDNGLAVDQGVFFHPDFMLLAMQKQISFNISPLHSNLKFGYVISADCVFGAKLGIDGSKKHILNCAAASGSSVVMA